jgi:hypothetical protein
MNMKPEEIIDVFSSFRQECPLDTYGLPFESPLPVEEKLSETLPIVRGLPAGELKILRASIDLHLAVLLNRYARRMASAAVCKKKNELVQCALIAISLDNNLLDERDVYRTGALIIDCIRRRNLDPTLCFDNDLAIAHENRRALLTRQLKTAPQYMRSLQAMKFGVVGTETDFTYVDHMFDSPVAIDVELLNKTIDDLVSDASMNKTNETKGSNET